LTEEPDAAVGGGPANPEPTPDQPAPGEEQAPNVEPLPEGGSGNEQGDEPETTTQPED
jgi:hypothetical protein